MNDKTSLKKLYLALAQLFELEDIGVCSLKNAKNVVFFIGIDGENEVIKIDASRKKLEYPMRVRDGGANTSFIFSEEGILRFIKGAVLNDLWLSSDLSFGGDLKSVFESSLVLSEIIYKVTKGSEFLKAEESNPSDRSEPGQGSILTRSIH